MNARIPFSALSFFLPFFAVGRMCRARLAACMGAAFI